MGSSLRDGPGAGLERSCHPDEWVDATGPVDGVELFRARLRGRPFSRHRHDVYAIGVTDEGVQAFEYRGTVERSFPGQVFVLHPDELHDGMAQGSGLFGCRQIYVNPDRIASTLPALTGRRRCRSPARVTDDPVLAHVVRTAFARAPEPLALDTLAPPARVTRCVLRRPPVSELSASRRTVRGGNPTTSASAARTSTAAPSLESM